MVLEKTIGGEAKKIVSEFRILQIDFVKLFVGDRQSLPILAALDRLCSLVFWRYESQFAQDSSGRDFDADFGYQEFARHRQEHFGRVIALAKQNVTLLVLPGRHERPKPVQ